ncbi:hypothetical protein H4219_000490 [Mycoemilia scoparia]|uniref:Thioredoxin domain-containing protein n=1 Tax=Mycoemilia scoparia TaxID=417184 RepID=A0A9W8A334_9FUNG|nr:hypothetical protein H4219_000490 [Mycoemilia scoparia]
MTGMAFLSRAVFRRALVLPRSAIFQGTRKNLTLNRFYGTKYDEVKEITDEEFEDVIGDSTKPTLVDFYAEWCGPCKTLGPILAEAVEKDGRVRLVKINTDEYQDAAAEYQVSALPTVIAFKDGKIVDDFVGMLNKKKVEEFIQGVVSKSEGK